MAKRIGASRPAQAKASTQPRKPLTLADMTVTHVFRQNKPVTLTGHEIAAILEGAQHLHAPDEKSDFVDAYAMYSEVFGIAETLAGLPLGVRPAPPVATEIGSVG